MPTLSLTRFFMICDVSCFAFSSLFGAISSASMLFETSIANTTSTPSLLTVSSFVPIFGLTNAIIKLTIANDKIMCLKVDLKTDCSGLSIFNRFSEANLFFVFFFQIIVHMNIISIPITRSNNQNQKSSSN